MGRRDLGHGMMPAPISLRETRLRRGGRDVVQGLTGVFAPGSMTAVTGPNGTGKSTLLQALCALYPVASGLIDRGGMKARDLALLPQEGRLDRSFPITCRDVVALGWTARMGLLRRIGSEQYAAASRALAAVGLEGVGAHPIGALSAGQFQRVLFARTMVRDAPVILLDEPFSAVDAATEDDLMAIIQTWRRQGRTIIAVLHDLDLIREAFPGTLLLGGGPAAWGPTSEVLARRYRHARAHAIGDGPQVPFPGGPLMRTMGGEPPPEADHGQTAMEASACFTT